MTDDDPILPLTLYAPELSYFGGKLESVLRYMELPYERIGKGPIGDIEAATGVAQVPALHLADGRWLTDSTPLIGWLNARYPDVSVIPRDPACAFFSRLVEDYADEWLWRPAMHYRWDYTESAAQQSRVLAVDDENARAVRLPVFVKRYIIRTRQRKVFTTGDGVNDETWDHVEQVYLDSLQHLSAIFDQRPYLLGSRPSLADFGFFGPMFRHFGMDPPSARIMRETAPAVFEWVARLWNARASRMADDLLDEVPQDWSPILDSIGSAYLPYLCANAESWKKKQSHFDVEIEGVPYRRLRTSRYRVWCLEELRRHFDELPESQQPAVRARLEAHGCWEPLWRVENPAAGIASSAIELDPAAPPMVGHSMTGMGPGDADVLHWLPSRPARRTE